MSKFDGGKKKRAELGFNASLFDIVFMLLFFFMVGTNLDNESSVLVSLPAVETGKLEDKTPTIHSIRDS